VVLLLVLGLGIWYIARRSREAEALGEIRLLDDEAAKLIHDHTPTTLQFRGVSYRIGDKQILDNIHGIVKPGEVMAIMGASGAGKTSFLDILARKRKKGIVDGEFFLNGKSVSDAQFKRVVGFVDQEDTLMPSLTVYETILYSALLRLPKNMSVAAKKYRVLETMEELGILGIKDTRIGNEGERGISGGEKRRVTIACELVTSPSILFMDEPVYPSHELFDLR
jgi:ABC-type multidrug transport system ATPase subunit